LARVEPGSELVGSLLCCRPGRSGRNPPACQQWIVAGQGAAARADVGDVALSV